MSGKVLWYGEIDIHTVSLSPFKTKVEGDYFQLPVWNRSLPVLTPKSCLGTDRGEESAQAKPMPRPTL